jgi:hypothetical protein
VILNLGQDEGVGVVRLSFALLFESNCSFKFSIGFKKKSHKNVGFHRVDKHSGGWKLSFI